MARSKQKSSRRTAKRRRALGREAVRLVADQRFYWALCGAALFLYVYVLLRTAWLCDDAYITFRVVDNLANGYGLRWNVADRVQAYTHPLWMLVITIPYVLTREIFYTAIIVSLLLSLGAVFLVGFRLASKPAAGLLAIAILSSSKAFVEYSTSGLENALTHLLLVLLVLHTTKPITGTRDVFWRSTIAGLGILNRLDTALLFAPILLWSIHREGRLKAWPGLALGMWPVAIWLAFSVFYYGYPFPNTALAKLNTGVGSWELLGHAPHYFWNSLRSDPITLVTIAAAVAVAMVTRSKELFGLVAAIALYLAYVVKIGGDFMSGRFFTAPLLCAVIILAMHRWPGQEAWRGALAVAAIGLGFISPYPVFLSDSEYGLYRTDILDKHGVADERAYYYRTAGLFNGRSGPKPANLILTRVRASRECGYPVAVEGMIGFVGFRAGPGIHIVDYHALADPVLSRLPMVKRDPLYEGFYEALVGERCPERFRIGHFLRSIPPGYLGYIAGNEHALENPDLKRFVETVFLITRGPLLDPERLKALLPFCLGLDDDWIRAEEHETWVKPRWNEVIAAIPDSPVGYARIGVELVRAGNLDGAEASLRKALERCPDDTNTLVNLSIVFWQMGRDAEALENCMRALALDPDLERAYDGLGRLYTRQGRLEDAVDAFENALRLDRNYVEALSGLARAHIMAGRYRAALTAAEAVTRHRPRDPEALMNLGLIHARLGNRGEAIEAWRRAARRGSKEAKDILARIRSAD